MRQELFLFLLDFFFFLLFLIRILRERQHARTCRCLVIVCFLYLRVSSHLANGADSSLSKKKFLSLLKISSF
jgi:hypothetical protein